MHKPVEQHVLEAFVTRKFGWNSLSTEQQLSLAAEVLRARYLLQKQYKFLAESLDDLNGFKELTTVVATGSSRHGADNKHRD